MAPADPDTDSIEPGDRFRHLIWGYYWDTETITTWKLLVTVGTLIAYPPVGVFLFVFFSVLAITDDPEDRLEESS